ncbi:hypothetical protein PanWU01x14_339720, partial [Parasponia andersonii]
VGHASPLNKNIGQVGLVQSLCRLIKYRSDRSDPTHFTSLEIGIFICCFRGSEVY